MYTQPQPSAGFYNAPTAQPMYSQPAAPQYQYPPASGFEQPAAGNLAFYSTGYDAGNGMNMMSADMSGQMGAPSGSLGSAGGFEEDPPLLEELGINFTDIRNRMMYVLLPSKTVGTKSLEDTDLAGPLLFALALGVSLMLTGKLQFGFIYGCSLMGSVFMWAVLNLLHEQGIDMYRVCSVLGYGLVPIVLLALFNVVLDLKGHVGFLLSLLAIFWCAFSASRLFEKMLELAEQRWLVAYPLCLVYTCFALITVF